MWFVLPQKRLSSSAHIPLPGSVRTLDTDGSFFAMATEIHQVGSETPPSSDKDRIDEKNTVISEDIEGNSDEESKRLVADRAEATELTPVEAFKWNVEGDQSPCTSTEAHYSQSTKILTFVSSSGSRSLRA